MLSGVGLALCFPTWHLFPMAWVALVPLLIRAHQASTAETARQFIVAGFTFYLVLLQWLMSNIYWAGGWAIWGYALLSLFMASYWGLTGFLWQRLRPRFRGLAAIGLAILWAAMEHLQGTLFGGFGWGSLAYSQGPDLPFLQWAAIGGAPLVSLVLVLVNALLAELILERKGRIVRAVACLVVLAGVHGAGYAMLGDPHYGEKKFTAGIVQSNFPLEMKWDWEYTEEMVRNTSDKSRWMAHNQKIDLLVWPESLLMDSIDRPGIHELVTGLCRETGSALYTGAVRFEDGTREELNSSYLINGAGIIETYYDKIHLAPFGEYVPFGNYIPFIKQVVPSIGDIASGNEPKVLPAGERRFGPLICFEVLFGPMAERLRSMGADMLVVITNLGWFGESNAIPEELEIARVRAIETRLPLIHSANTGVSGVFDPWGRFTGIYNAFDSRGDVVSYRDRITPQETIRQRLFGAIDIPLPERQPVPGGPTVFPWLALGASVILTALSFLRRSPSV